MNLLVLYQQNDIPLVTLPTECTHFSFSFSLRSIPLGNCDGIASVGKFGWEYQLIQFLKTVFQMRPKIRECPDDILV